MSAPGRAQGRLRESTVAPPPADILTEPSKPVWVPTGKRKQTPAVPFVAKRLEWPPAPAERYELLDLWFYLAPQIAGRLPTLLGLRKWINRETGTAWATDETLARWSGHISLSKAGKDVSRLVLFGLFLTKHSFEADKAGKLRKRRTLILALPQPLPVGVNIPPNWDEVAHEDEKHLAPRVRDEKPGRGRRKQQTYRTRDPKTCRTTCDDITGVSLDLTSFEETGAAVDNSYSRAKAVSIEPGTGDFGARDEAARQSCDDAPRRTAGLEGPAFTGSAVPSEKGKP
ncbi:hypothetical protein NKI34_10450 [Mesorhizobium sp. M0700]|uniref:hypothetical protein n=1 Tax=Mesorhizobium sp. M0700 TaxID=2956988 RepID=UPI003338BE0B